MDIREKLNLSEERFFVRHRNLGKKNDWRLILDDKIRVKLEEAFEKELIELGYL